MSERGQVAGTRRLLLATGAALLAGVGLTAAAFTDQAHLAMGTGSQHAVGNPNRFDIAIQDADGTWRDAETTALAVVLPLSGDATLSTTDPVEFSAVIGNRDPGVAGILGLALYDPDPTDADLFGLLRFTVALDGDRVAENVSAEDFNDLDIVIGDVAPGDEHTVRIQAVLARSGLDIAGRTTQIGLRVNGESR